MSNLAPNIDLAQIWKSICFELPSVVSADAVNRWFHPLRDQDYAHRSITLASDNSIYQYWIEENYLSQLKATASRVLGEPVSILFHAPQIANGATTESVPAKVEPVKVRKESLRLAPSVSTDSRGCLNPRSTFESFVL